METAHAIVHSSPPSSESSYDVDYCMWKDLSYSECERLLDAANGHDHIKAILKDIWKIDVAMETSSQALISTDLYAYGVIFARKNNYSPIQLSTLISIMKRVHEACICTPFDNLDVTMKMFQELMVKHSVQRPPHSTSVFNIAQVRLTLLFGPQLPDGGEEEMEGGESSSKDKKTKAVEEREGEQLQVEVATDETSSTEKPEKESSVETEEHSKLKSLISSTINEKLEQIQATLEINMQRQEEELLARITSLEQTATGNAKQASKNKKTK